MPHAAGLWYDWHGPEDGEVLILSPGLGGSADYWAPNLAAFAAHHRVLLYDHRGTGRSDRSLPEQVSVDDFANDILALMDALGIEAATLIGHAAGGIAGLALALKAPERLPRLVLVNCWAAPDPHFLRCFEARLALLDGKGPESYLRAQPIFLYPADWSSVHHAELDAELPAQLEHFQGAGALRKRVAALAGFDISGRLAEIATPVLVVAARDDMLVPSRAGEALADALPNSGLAMPAFGGHACNVTYPDEFNDFILAWLRGELP
ncbi:MAG TPA: pyrimidine utilization protein D [Allosphingosinicella sp.]|nr:pyrimidine utilization protein D [Allosphingosinicella sp.]